MANPESDDTGITPEMQFQFYKVRLTEVLDKHNPAGIATIGSLLKQFPGKEHQVYAQICKKCGVDPVDKPTIADFDEFKKPFPLEKKNDGRVSKWLTQLGPPHSNLANQHQFKVMTWDALLKIQTKGKLIELGVIPRNADALLSKIRIEAGDKAPAPAEPSPQRPAADFEVGENCYTKVVSTSKSGGEKWLNARITRVNVDGDENTFDIFVYNSKAHGVPPEAVNVPRSMLKKGTENVQVAVPEKRAAKRPQFQQGDRVRVFGLRSHTSYNGLCGTVLLYVPSERRYQVRLDTNDVIAIKQRNVAPEHGEAPKGANDEASKKKKKGEKADQDQLSELMSKLMQDNPDADPGKLGEFAAGYLLAKKKLNNA